MAPHDERRPRVLVEHGSAIVRLDLVEELTQAGFEVLTCAGPAHLEGGCPLLAGGECQLANHAHVILNALGEPQVEVYVAQRTRLRHRRPILAQLDRGTADGLARVLDGIDRTGPIPAGPAIVEALQKLLHREADLA